MYERMLDKHVKPSFDDMIRYSGGQGELWRALDQYIDEAFSAERFIRFP